MEKKFWHWGGKLHWKQHGGGLATNVKCLTSKIIRRGQGCRGWEKPLIHGIISHPIASCIVNSTTKRTAIQTKQLLDITEQLFVIGSWKWMCLVNWDDQSIRTSYKRQDTNENVHNSVASTPVGGKTSHSVYCHEPKWTIMINVTVKNKTMHNRRQ